jgi:diguanylate cyclase (GGDEF)-like protein/excisionase family DNA binding protein
VPLPLTPRPIDATLSVTKAARLLGVHPNTVRAWSDAGRLRYYRINDRGDRRYRVGDLQRFLALAASGGTEPAHSSRAPRRGGFAPATLPWPEGVAKPEVVEDVAPRPPSAPIGDSTGELSLIADLAELAAPHDTVRNLDRLLQRAARLMRDSQPFHAVAIWQLVDDRLEPRAIAGPAHAVAVASPADRGLAGEALLEMRRNPTPRATEHLVEPVATIHTTDTPGPALISGTSGLPRIAAAIPTNADAWGLIVAVGRPGAVFTEHDREVIEAAVRTLASTIRVETAMTEVEHRLQRADAMRRVTSDIASRLDLEQVLTGVADHALVLFEADRVGVFVRRPDGRVVAEVSRGLSARFLAAVRHFPSPSLPAAAIVARRPLYSVNYRDDPRGSGVRAAVVQEGFDTLATAPFLDGVEALGMLNVYHDRPHHWTDAELEALAALANQAALAIRTAQTYSRMAAWAAQLQAIQQLGARLSGLTSVREIGLAIATELNRLIESHNVRVYRRYSDELLPVAMQGRVGEYVDETPEQLKVQIGEGITGWVAEHRIAQNLGDAASDPRASTIPGTEDDLDESMLLAPMIHEDEVIGVLVLSRLGLHQFHDDDLRLLVIFASFAAQAMANADATQKLREQSEALERQLLGQRELLRITESILSTLDPRAVLDQIAERIGAIVRCDNIAIEAVDPVSGLLTPLVAKGVHADYYLEPWEEGETGIATWVVDHDEPVLILDQAGDPRVNHSVEIGPQAGGLIVVPLRSRDRATGVLTLERLGDGSVFTNDEFDLVKLFAAQVSIALQNAEVHRAVEIRARTDDLTGLLNHGTFREWLAKGVAAGEPFSLLMIDLDDFKAVNDALGHQAGDLFLADIARVLVAAGRDTDHVFRYGGDEFALVLPRTDGASASAVAARVLSAIEAMGRPGGRWHGKGVPVSASLGVASYPIDGATADGLLLAADRACFVAKRSGSARIANADEGLALAAEFSLKDPTPVDPPTAAA